MDIVDKLIKVTAGDLEPPMEFEITKNKEPVDLTGKTVKILAKDSEETVIDFRTADIHDAKNGIARLSLVADEFDHKGKYLIYAIVVHATERPETYPTDASWVLQVKIH